jgi:uncharacterized protein (DUF736 family)
MSTNYQHRPGQGSLFKNDKKTSDKHPSLKGKVMLPDGSLHWVSAWSKKTSAGEPWISLQIGEPVAGQAMDAHNTAKGNGYQPQGDDSDIPF